jgi:hypothetical protein
MHVLLPDDPVFVSKFLAIERPLLWSLHYLYAQELGVEQAGVVRDAYDSWGELLKRLPAPLQWQLPAEEHSPQGYTLDAPRGRRLRSLYPMEVSTRHLERLTSCQRMLSQAGSGFGADPLAYALTDLTDDEPCDLVEDFRRVLAVMQLSAPPNLLATLKEAAPAGPNIAISLDAEQAEEHRELCGRIVYALSAGDSFNYNNHHALYAS